MVTLLQRDVVDHANEMELQKHTNKFKLPKLLHLIMDTHDQFLLILLLFSVHRSTIVPQEQEDEINPVKLL